MPSYREIDLSGTSNDIARWVWKNLVPKSGQADSLQGELLRAIEKLRWEAQNNGNINWDNRFEMLIDFLESTFLESNCFSAATKDTIRQDLGRLRHFLPPNELRSRSQVSELPYVEDDLYDRLTEHLVAFCRECPQIIAHDKNPDQYR